MAKAETTAPVRARRIPNAKPGETPPATDTKRETTAKAADAAKSKAVKASAETKEATAKLKAAEKAAKEKEKAAKKEADAKAKAAAQAKAEKVLTPLAGRVNARLEKIAMIEGKADDHRLSAAIELAEAKTECEAAGLSFKKWCEENIKQSFENVRKLVYIGSYPADQGGPTKALEDLRNKNAQANKTLREKKAKEAKALRGKPITPAEVAPTTSKRDTPFQRAEAAYAELPPEAAKELVGSQAAQLGLQVLTDKEVKGLKSGGGAKGIDGITAAFDALNAQDKLMVCDHIERKLGYHLVDGDDYKLLQAAKKAAKKAA